MKSGFVLFLIMSCAMFSHGEIVYVDADTSNVTVNGAVLVDGVNYADGSNSITDGLWGTRSRSSVNGGYVWTTDAPLNGVYAEITEPLIVTMTIAAPAGEYRVFGLFSISQQGTSDWDCGFSLDGETYINYTKDNSTQAQTSFFSDSVIVADVDGTSYLFVVQLGTVTTTAANEQISVYVQGLDIGDIDNRTWFEGIAYQDSSEAALIPEPFVIPEEPNIQPPTLQDVTLNKKDTGFRGIWYYSNYLGDDAEDVYKYHYSGGLGTYCTRHRPMAIYSPESDKTFFCYGGASAASDRRLLHMVGCYDNQTNEMQMPTLLLDKHTGDAHENPTMSIDGDGHIWIFSTSHGTGPASYIHKSKLPYDIDEFELVESTKIDSEGNVVPFTNFSYFQPWSDGADGFSAFLTIYDDPVKRTTQFMKTTDGVNWSQPQKICIAGRGAYQISGQYGSKLAAAFNYHPDGEDGKTGVLWRTNLYYVETLDNGVTWQTVDGTPVTLPLVTEDILTTPMLVRNGMSPTWKNVYLTDIRFDSVGNPVILHLTAAGGYPGPESDPRYLEIAHWDGSNWVFSTVAQVDHNYDGGSLYIEDDGATWRIIGTFEPGPQAYGIGGEVSQYVSYDQGVTWTKLMDMTSNSTFNHNHVRRPLNADPDFYGFWADGNDWELSESNIYYCDKAGNVTKLPRGTGPAADDCEYLVPEDINHDCEVNFSDYSAIAESWQATGSNFPTDFSEDKYIGSDVEDSFEVDSVSQLPYTLLSGTAATVSTTRPYSGVKSLYWSSSEYGYYGFDPFDGASVSNLVVSVQVYLPRTTSEGRAIIGIYDEEVHDNLIVVDRDADGIYDILYRAQGVYTRTLEDINYGWHQLSFVVHNNNAVGIYCDNQYITTTTNFTGGLKTVRFGKPWSGYQGLAVFYDDLKVTCNTDVVGGGSPTLADIYEDFEYVSIDGMTNIGGYVYDGAPTFSDVIKRSGNQVFCNSNGYGTIVTKTLPTTMRNCRVSIWCYVPYVNSGDGYLYLISPEGYAFIGVRQDPDRVYYRTNVSSTTGYDISKGWHLMSFIVDYQGHFHMFFDNNYLGTYTSTTGVDAIRFGGMWSTEGYISFDSLTLNGDIRGGFMGDWNTIYQQGDLNQDGVNNTDDLDMMVEKWLIDADLYSYVKPEPAVYLTFDDKYISEWVAAMPIFNQYNVKATFCIAYFDELDSTDIAGINTLKAAGHAIACHSLNHESALDYVNQYSLEQYWLDDVKPALDLMEAEGLYPSCFAYPYSHNDKRTDQMLLDHFRYLRSGVAFEDSYRIFNDPAKLEAGGVFYSVCIDSNRTNFVTEDLYELMDEAKSRNGSIVFLGHNLMQEPGSGNYTSLERLQNVLSYGTSIGLKFKVFE